jgi:redox-sensitive bicupin YhaK (pirin superfamily)
MMTLRRAEDRGRSRSVWLDSRHTFSFADYRDAEHTSFRSLRVLNEDRVRPDSGFGSHPHRDMEIITYVLEGRLEHEDNLGNRSVIYPGQVQRMSAGTGVVHSEWNPSSVEEVWFLQVWIVPELAGMSPSYEQRSFEPHELRGQLRLVASSDGREGSVKIHQDAELYATRLTPGQVVRRQLLTGRHAYVQVVRGSVQLNGTPLRAGDGAAVSNEPGLELGATEEAEALLFDLA